MYLKPTRNYNIVDIIFWFFDFNDHYGSSILMITLVHQGAAVWLWAVEELQRFQEQGRNWKNERYGSELILCREDDEQCVKDAYLKLRDVLLSFVSSRDTRTTAHEFINLFRFPISFYEQLVCCAS